MASFLGITFKKKSEPSIHTAWERRGRNYIGPVYAYIPQACLVDVELRTNEIVKSISFVLVRPEMKKKDLQEHIKDGRLIRISVSQGEWDKIEALPGLARIISSKGLVGEYAPTLGRFEMVKVKEIDIGPLSEEEYKKISNVTIKNLW